MAWFAVSAVLLWAICLGLTVASRQDQPFFHRPAFIFTGVASLAAGFGLLVLGSSAAAENERAYGPLFVIMGFVPGLLLLIPWLIRVVAIVTDEAQRSVTGLDHMKVRRSYDEAGRLMHERRFDEAEREGLEGAVEQPDDPEPLRLAGEAALAAGRVQDAVGHFRGALARITSDEDRASLAIRIAEIEERRLGDAAGARRTLERILPDLYPGKWGDYVRERLDRLGRPS